VIGPRSSAYAVLRGIDSASAPARAEVSGSLIAVQLKTFFETLDKRKTFHRSRRVELAARTGLKVGGRG